MNDTSDQYAQGVVLGAIYMLTLYMRTMFGEIDHEKNGGLHDITPLECATLAPLVLMVFWIGLFPQPFLRTMQPTIDRYISDIDHRIGARAGGGRGAEALAVPDPGLAVPGGNH